ncbi:TonB-dependent receptor [Granulicella sp. WH15]|uniref:TonB-dependent receptor n=1 Tax=Granulicella sp. WH15 TaxID=2602070 RepID=UPI001366FFAB|nr:TonB-dependent receptor [Granulicella sp. WH15]QHN05227.1 TonB-dependent receptor [Granulicella sp. WH15]
MRKLSSLVLSGCSIFVAATSFAQSSTQGAIGGTVFDTTNSAVPKAAITIHNNGTNAEVKLTTDDSGFFKAPLLEPGIYVVTVGASGFSSYRDQVTVQVGQLTNIIPHLIAGGASESVEVSADVPVLNFESPDFSSNINQKALEDIPVNNRRWSALALLTPGVTVDSSGFGLISVRGISTILNNIEIDGADDNQAYFAEERGRTREAYSTSGSAVREFQVNTGVYPAEYGRAAGGVVNSVTKSGTNELHGQLYFYDRESKWNAFNDQSTIPQVSSSGTVTNVPFKPKDIRKIYGFSAGGPIIKDKLFFFYTYDQHSRIFPLSGVASNPSSVNNSSSYGFNAQPDAVLPGSATCNITTGYLAGAPAGGNVIDAQACTLTARLKLSTYAAGAALYKSDLAALNTDLGLIPRTGYQEINTPKLDYQINSKEHVEVLYHRLRWDSPGGVQTNATGDYSLDSTGTDFVKLDYGLAKLTSLFRSNLSNEMLYQYGRELNNEGQQPLSDYSKNVLQQANGNIPYITLDTKIGAFFGSPYYSYRPKYPDERKWQIGDTLYLSHGNHSFKFGVDIVHNYDLTNQAQYYEGNYIYSNNLANYFADLGAKGRGTCDAAQLVAATATASAVGAYPCYSTYQQGFGPTTFDFATLDYAIFAQDNYKITPRLTLELGLRYDYELTPAPVPALISQTTNFIPYTGIDNNPHDRNNFGPRVGFAYDVFGKGKTVLRGGFGAYYGRITNGNLGTVLATTGSPLAQTTPTVSASTGLASEPFFGNTFSPAQETTSAKAAGLFRAKNLQNPMVMEFDLQAQQQLGRGTYFQVSYLGALGRELPNFLDVNLNPATQVVNVTFIDTTGKSPIPNGSVIAVPTFTSHGNTALLGPSATNFSSISEYLSNVNSSYNALAAEIQNRSLKSLQFDASYTWAHALDFSQNATTAGGTNSWYDPYGNPRANYGNSQFNIPNRFVGYALYNLPNLVKGHGILSRAVNDWSLDNSFQFQTGLPYSASVSGSNSNSAISTSFNGSGGPSYIPQLGHNNLTYNRVLIDDVRVEKQFRFTERTYLQVFLQAFNVANHQNETSVFGTAFQLAKSTALTGTATYQSNFGTVSRTNNSGFSYTPRQLELSARLFF